MTITTNNSTQISTDQNTFGIATQKMIFALRPDIVSKKKIGNNFLLKNAQGETVATWHKRRMQTGLIVITN